MAVLSGRSGAALSLYIEKSKFTVDGGILVGTGAGTFQEETGDVLRASVGVGLLNSPQFAGLTLTGNITGPAAWDIIGGASTLEIRPAVTKTGTLYLGGSTTNWAGIVLGAQPNPIYLLSLDGSSPVLKSGHLSVGAGEVYLYAADDTVGVENVAGVFVYGTLGKVVIATSDSPSPVDRVNVDKNGKVWFYTGPLEIDVASGDPLIIFDTQGADKFCFGVDDSDSDKLKINSGSTLADSSLMELDSSGNFELAGKAYIPVIPDFATTHTASAILTVADLCKVHIFDSASDLTCTLPEGALGYLGWWIIIVKAGTGDLTIIAGGTNTILDSTAGGSIECTDNTYAMPKMGLRLLTATEWHSSMECFGKWSTR